MKEVPNLDYINKLSNGDAFIKNRLISSLKNEFLLDVANYKTNIQNLNFFQTSECVHKLKNKISILGLEKSYYIAENFEKNLKNNSVKLRSNFEQILRVIDLFLSKF